MAKNYFIISFTIVFDDTYSERRQSMLKAIRGHGKTYEDTTSFIAVNTDSDIDAVRRSAAYSEFNLSTDSLVIVECLASTFQTSGKAETVVFT